MFTPQFEVIWEPFEAIRTAVDSITKTVTQLGCHKLHSIRIAGDELELFYDLLVLFSATQCGLYGRLDYIHESLGEMDGKRPRVVVYRPRGSNSFSTGVSYRRLLCTTTSANQMETTIDRTLRVRVEDDNRAGRMPCVCS